MKWLGQTACFTISLCHKRVGGRRIPSAGILCKIIGYNSLAKFWEVVNEGAGNPEPPTKRTVYLHCGCCGCSIPLLAALAAVILEAAVRRRAHGGEGVCSSRTGQTSRTR